MTTALEELRDVRRPEEIFGTLVGDTEEQITELKATYRRLARAVHPDVVAKEDESAARVAFARLSQMYEVALEAVEDGTYGTSRAPTVDAVRVRTRRRSYRVSRLIGGGDSCNLYACVFTDDEDAERDGLIKVARDPADNDLLANEARTLKTLLSDKDAFDDLSPFLPTYLETFGYRAPGSKKPRQASAFRAVPGLYTLEQVRARYPSGIHPKDMAWMFRRLLYTLGFVHKHVIHAAILPPHVLLHPAQHGLVLLDWKYAVEPGETIRAISARHRGWYPREVLAKEPAGVGTDIFMAVRCMVYLLGGDPETGEVPEAALPRRLGLFFRGSTLPNEKGRPQNALELLDEFTELIERLWGPRTFRPFEM